MFNPQYIKNTSSMQLSYDKYDMQHESQYQKHKTLHYYQEPSFHAYKHKRKIDQFENIYLDSSTLIHHIKNIEHHHNQEPSFHAWKHEREVHQLGHIYLDSHSSPLQPPTYIEAIRFQLTLGKNCLILSGVISRSFTYAITLSMSFASPSKPSEL